MTKHLWTAAEPKNTEQDGRLDALPDALIGPKVVSRDTDGVPYWNPTTGTHRVFLDTDGVPALVDPPVQTWERTEADARFATKVHTHVTADVTGLDAALAAATAGQAPLSHTHVTSDVTGLDTAQAGKSASAHVHATSDVTGLDTPWRVRRRRRIRTSSRTSPTMFPGPS